MIFIVITALSAGLAGLALTYSISLSGMFQYCLRQSNEVEALVSHCLTDQLAFRRDVDL